MAFRFILCVGVILIEERGVLRLSCPLYIEYVYSEQYDNEVNLIDLWLKQDSQRM